MNNEAQKHSRIDTNLAELGKALESLDNAVEDIQSRLKPVLSPSPKADKEELEPSPADRICESDVAAYIRDATSRVNKAQENVFYLVARLEV